MGSLKTLGEILPGCASELPAGRPVLEFGDVRLRFGGVRALRGVSFDVRQDELFAVIGPNGAGKSSIFNCISSVYRPQEGSIEFLGRELTRTTPAEVARAGIARMFQNIALFDTLTVLDNVMLGRHQHIGYGTFAALLWRGRARREELRERAIVEEIVTFLGLGSYRKSPVGSLPYGVKKRVELGRALAMEPKLLLMDEPVAGMNVAETEDMALAILDIREELSIPIVLVEHDMGLVMDLADRVLVLDFGARVALGTPAEVQGDPNVIRAYLGEEHDVAGPAEAGGDLLAAVESMTQTCPHRHPDLRPGAAGPEGRRAAREVARHLAGDELGGVRRPGQRAAHGLLALGVRPVTAWRSRARTAPSGWSRTPARSRRGRVTAELDAAARVLIAEDQEQVDKALAAKAGAARSRVDRLHRAARRARLRRAVARLVARPARARGGAPRRASAPARRAGRGGRRRRPGHAGADRRRRERALATPLHPDPEPGDFVLCHLPMSQTSPRRSTAWLSAHAGVQLHFGEPAAGLVQTLNEVEPSLFLGTPAVWEELRATGAKRRRLGLRKCRSAVSTAPIPPGALRVVPAARPRGARGVA